MLPHFFFLGQKKIFLTALYFLTIIKWSFDICSKVYLTSLYFVKRNFFFFQECITAGHFQNLHPNVTCKSPTGKSGSKFVTVIVTGDADNQVHSEGYQVSTQVGMNTF